MPQGSRGASRQPRAGTCRAKLRANKNKGKLCQYDTLVGCPTHLRRRGRTDGRGRDHSRITATAQITSPGSVRRGPVCSLNLTAGGGGQFFRSRWTEDCLQCNICGPSGTPPTCSGRPFLFFTRKYGCCASTIFDILLSDVREGYTTYAKWRPPKSGDLESTRTRLRADHHPDGVVDVINRHSQMSHDPGGAAGGDLGEMYSGVQVRLSLRGFTNKLATHGARRLVRRVRAEWMASTAKGRTPKCMGVTHGTESPI